MPDLSAPTLALPTKGEGPVNESRSASPITHVAITRLVANPDQPRRHFDPGSMAALAGSIQRQGVLQPVLVRRVGEDVETCDYQIIAGERRWRAARKAGLTEVPVYIRACTDGEALEIGIIENDQREGLNPMEEARAYHHLMTGFGYTQQEISLAVGRSRPYVANMLRLLRLPGSVQIYLIEGKLAIGHARALLSAYDPAGLAEMIIARSLSVRAAEKLVKREVRLRGEEARAAKVDINGDKAAEVNFAVTEHRLAEMLGMKVDLRNYGESGYIKIRYRSIEDYQKLVGRLSRVAG